MAVCEIHIFLMCALVCTLLGLIRDVTITGTLIKFPLITVVWQLTVLSIYLN